MDRSSAAEGEDVVSDQNADSAIRPRGSEIVALQSAILVSLILGIRDRKRADP